ncbi:hypothetical protein BWI93_14620 [Siphonobacter sp. BAB-5385]|uniref:hypothetical protein n=1 Tax=Siphonobacter sp. BAB-5385 TaxID=1864822 RepID=UPI000B9E7FFD|nr:hypothetical protein [Siphonobacter sp. BAB-5385]OZI07561.1 hypothetical protein BWI93_14620 [Siphonobacter sp. BAB-5385]
MNSAYEVTLQSQAKEISIKNVLISTYESNQKTMAARYVAREQQLQTEVDGWKKRFELSEADRVRLQKERDKNGRFIAPSIGVSLLTGLAIGLLIGR